MTEAEWGPGGRLVLPPQAPSAEDSDPAAAATAPGQSDDSDPAPTSDPVPPEDTPPVPPEDTRPVPEDTPPVPPEVTAAAMPTDRPRRADEEPAEATEGHLYWDEPAAVTPGVSPWRRLRRSVSREELSTIERLRDGQAELRDRLAGWVVTISITVIAFLIRLVNLGYPNKLVFDETYYPKDGWTLWKFGYEKDWPSTANASITEGNVNVFKDSAEFVVHPPVGKWLIGFGEQLFGMNSFGWRFMPLVFGTLLVFITIRMARRLSRSTMVGAIAGILITLDGLAFAMSRIGLLDIFQAFFIVAAVSCLIADRDWYRHQLADRLEALGVPDFGGRFGPMIWLRPWRLAAGVLFGLAIGTKWNSLFVLAAMGVLTVLWDVGARRLAGADWRSWFALIADGGPAFVRLVVVSALVYVVTWAGWLSTSGGYDRNWGENNPDSPWTVHLGPMWASFLKYHQEIYNFHTGDYINNLKPHPYAAPPIGWLVMARPIGIDAVNDIKPGVDGCPVGPDNCIRVISGMGTPVLWWMAAIALIVGLIWWLGGRDWRFGVPIVAAMATYLPWFSPGGRSLFFFYAICIIPFTITLLAMVFGLIMGPADGPNRRRGAIIVGVAMALVAANFAYIYPVLTDQLMLYKDWLARMWLRSWI